MAFKKFLHGERKFLNDAKSFTLLFTAKKKTHYSLLLTFFRYTPILKNLECNKVTFKPLVTTVVLLCLELDVLQREAPQFTL